MVTINLLGARSDKLLDNVDWDRVRAVKDFYLNIPPMADMEQLWRRIERHRPIAQLLQNANHASVRCVCDPNHP
jgi:hypothetical protein